VNAKESSEEDDDTVFIAYRFINSAWVPIGQEKAAMMEVKIGTVYKMEGGSLVPDTDKNKLIYGKHTPQAMVDAGRYRIPPRVGTRLWVKLSVALGAGKELLLAHTNDSADNGRVQLAYNAVPGLHPKFYDLKALTILPGDLNAANTGTFFVRGREVYRAVFQTKVGHAKELKLGVFSRIDDNGNFADQKVLSAGFSVAAIPIKVEMSQPEAVSGKRWSLEKINGKDVYYFHFGIRYKINYVSDSGDSHIADLDKVKISEKIPLKAGSEYGRYKKTKVPFVPSGFRPATEIIKEPKYDYHTIERGVEKQLVEGNDKNPVTHRKKAAEELQKTIDTGGTSGYTRLQFFVFVDERSGATDESKPALVASSGFSIEHKEGKDVNGKYYFSVRKTALANNGVGAGIIPQSASGWFSDEIK